MNIGKAVAICERIDSEEYGIEDKLLAVHEVMNMPTHMGVTKDTLIGMIKWLWNFNLEISESHNGKRIVEIQTPHGDLIDREKLKELLLDLWKNGNNYTVADIIREIVDIPTIIEAEEVKE